MLCLCGSLELVEKKGQTPLYHAVVGQHGDIVQLLLDRGWRLAATATSTDRAGPQLDARAEGTPRPEVAESIVAVHTVPLDQLVELVRIEEIDDGFTVQAIGLLAIDRGGLG